MAFLLTSTAGCGLFGRKQSEPPQRPQEVGRYAPPADPSAPRPRLGVPAFRVTDRPAKEAGPDAAGGSSAAGSTARPPGAVDDAAADVAADLLARSGRFVVVDRAALAAASQGQPGQSPTRPGAAPTTGPVAGVDYLLVGRVTGLRVTPVKGSVGASPGKAAEADVAAECVVSLEVVEPRTGLVVVSTNSRFQRTGPAVGFGLGPRPAPAGDPQSPLALSDEEQVNVVRLAIDEAIRESLPKIDRYLASLAGPTAEPAAPPTTAPVAPGGASTPAATPPSTATGAAAHSTEVPSHPPAPTTPPSTSVAPPGPTVAGQGAATTAPGVPSPAPGTPTGSAGLVAPPSDPAGCPTCGRPNPPGEAFCVHCGAKLR